MLDTMKQVIDEFSDRDVIFADIRQEDRSQNRILVINGALRQFSSRSKSGTVARALVGECWGQASSTQPISSDSLTKLLVDAVKMARAGSGYSRKTIELAELRPHEKSAKQKLKENPVDISPEEKLGFVMDLDAAQKIDDKIVNANSIYMDRKSVCRLVNTIGSKLEWDEFRTGVIVQSVARDESNMEFDYEIRTGTGGYEIARGVDVNEFATTAAKGALDLLKAKKPPSGKMTAVVDGDISGLIAHEVCGHASEADEVVKGRSFLTNLVGTKIGTEQVTMVDDGSMEGLDGSLPFDSEGTPSSRTTIIDHGELVGFLHTLETASIMGVEPTGNGRAQDYNRRIFARMTNTFFDAGDWTDDEIIADTNKGLYVAKSHSGMEDVVGGGVQCRALKGYLIENGEKTDLVRGMAITGKVLDILQTVDAVGKTFSFSGGTCGKGEEDYIPVSSGGPHMRAEVVVGGG